MPVSLADESENEKLFDFYAEFDISVNIILCNFFIYHF